MTIDPLDGVTLEDRMIIRKTNLLDLEYLEALDTAMSEWESEEDEKVYKDL